MPEVNLSLYSEEYLLDCCLTMLNEIKDAEPSFQKYFTLKSFYDTLAVKHGLIIPTNYSHQLMIRDAFQSLCPHQIDLPSHTKFDVINNTCQQMIPDGLVGIATNYGIKHSLFFSDISDMMMFRLFLPPLGD